MNEIIGILTCLFTAALVTVAFYQLRDLKNTQNAQFLVNLIKEIETEEALMLITLLHNDCLTFVNNNNCPIFEVDIEKFKKIFPYREWAIRGFYTSYEVDVFLLNHLDAVGLMEENGVVELKYAYHYLGWYIKVATVNVAIQEYFSWLEEVEGSAYVFEKLQLISKKF